MEAFVQAIRFRPRLFGAAALGLVIYAALAPAGLRGSTRCLLAWDGALLLWLGLIAVMMARADLAAMQSRADEDEGARTILLLSVLAAVTSFAAIGVELSASKDATDGAKLVSVTLAGTTILLSWLFVHAMFAIHYAHDYYRGEVDRRGIKVPATPDPDYWDFAYFAFNLGAAAQTSDIAIESKNTRRMVLLHTVVSFLFNTTVLALAINVGAGLI